MKTNRRKTEDEKTEKRPRESRAARTPRSPRKNRAPPQDASNARPAPQCTADRTAMTKKTSMKSRREDDDGAEELAEEHRQRERHREPATLPTRLLELRSASKNRNYNKPTKA